MPSERSVSTLQLGPFYQYWLRSRAEGNPDNLWNYSINALAATVHRFDRVDPGPNGQFAYAYHFDARLYAAYLRDYSEARGVTRTQGRIPLQFRLGNGHVYCSAFMSDDEAASVLLANLDGKATADPKPLRFTTGRCREFWHKNCVALCLAAGFMEPLESTSIHLVQKGISRLVGNFPSSPGDEVTPRLYNRQMLAEFDGIRDFLILHYKANQREGSEFWRACREMRVPDELDYRMQLFREGAQVYSAQSDIFPEGSWVQVLLGQNVLPRTYHRLADSIGSAELHEYMSRVKGAVVNTVRKMPSHADFIATHCAMDAKGQ